VRRSIVARLGAGRHAVRRIKNKQIALYFWAFRTDGRHRNRLVEFVAGAFVQLRMEFFVAALSFFMDSLLERHMPNITAAILAAGLLISPAASAAEGALPAGKPAGVHPAQLLTTPVIIVGVVAAAAAGIAIGSTHSAPTTSVVATSP
jgi:hypothetical protein